MVYKYIDNATQCATLSMFCTYITWQLKIYGILLTFWRLQSARDSSTSTLHTQRKMASRAVARAKINQRCMSFLRNRKPMSRALINPSNVSQLTRRKECTFYAQTMSWQDARRTLLCVKKLICFVSWTRHSWVRYLLTMHEFARLVVSSSTDVLCADGQTYAWKEGRQFGCMSFHNE